MKYTKLIFSLCIASLSLASCRTVEMCDVLVVGGGTSGTAAGIASARMGTKTILIEETPWLGGMLTSAGVTAIDGNHDLPAGVWGEFRDSLIAHYGSKKALATGWVSRVLFEPSVGNSIWQKIARNEKNLTPYFRTSVEKITYKKQKWMIDINCQGKKRTIETKVLIDATELGDVAKATGVGYDIGMEARSICGENIAPEKANDVIQDLTYVAILKDYGENADKSIPKPEGYDPSYFYCSCASDKCTHPKEGDRVWSVEKMLSYGKLPNGKIMLNWPIEGNDYYLNTIEMTPKEREAALKKAKNFTLSFLYYIQNELGYKNIGLADDEFPTEDKLPFIPYHRESRRIHGWVRFDINHVAKPYDQQYALYRTGIAVGDYPVDHHHGRHPQWSSLPQLYFYPVPSYSLPLGALIPQKVKGLIVAEKSISVSNILNGSTRLQPVVLQIGQAAGTLAAIAVKLKKEIADVPVRTVQQSILQQNGYILPYLDLPQTHPHFEAVQRIGATGILRGEGKNAGWSNQTWFNTDSLTATKELVDGLSSLYPRFTYSTKEHGVTIQDMQNILQKLGTETVIDNRLWNTLSLSRYDTSRPLTRLEVAVILDKLLHPFESVPIDLYGNPTKK